MLRKAHLLLLGAALVSHPLCAISPARAADTKWEEVRVEAGIRSSQRHVTGQALPAFRAHAVIDADLWELLAILEDVDRAAEWTAHCAEMKKLGAPSPREMFVYARMDAPWPVRDRDVVVHIRVDYAGPGRVDVTIASVELRSEPARAGVVRMPRMHAGYHFRSLGFGKTEVTYELEVDAGGTLPTWLKSMVSRDLAHDTLHRLRSRARWSCARGLYRRRAMELKSMADATG